MEGSFGVEAVVVMRQPSDTGAKIGEQFRAESGSGTLADLQY
jgi:hypothetical protein